MFECEEIGLRRIEAFECTTATMARARLDKQMFLIGGLYVG